MSGIYALSEATSQSASAYAHEVSSSSRTPEGSCCHDAEGEACALTDLQTLQAVMRSLHRLAPKAKINPSQCRLVLRRLRIIYDMLFRMPNKTPTPQLLSTFRAAEYTVRRMVCGRWRYVLQQLFTCNALFDCLRSRIRAVWSLHSTATWEREDKAALQADETWNLEVILSDPSLVPATLWADAPAPPFTTREREQDRDSDDQDRDDVGTTTACSRLGNDALRDGLLHFYRRRFASQWKVAVDDLAPHCLPETETPGAAALPDELGNLLVPPDALEAANGWTTQRMFAIPPTHASPRAAGSARTTTTDNPLREREGIGRTSRSASLEAEPDGGDDTGFNGLFNDSSLLSFGSAVELQRIPPSGGSRGQDAANGGPTHPDGATDSSAVEPTLGTLAKRFSVRYEGLAYRGSQVVVKRLRDPQLITPSTLEAFVMDAAVRVRWSHPNLVTVHGGFCEEFDGDAQPFLSLGLVMADVCTAPERFVPLQRMLFFEGRRFSVKDAISVTLQVADALQFVLFDQSDVPAAVGHVWRCVSPSNIFVLDRDPWAPQLEDDGVPSAMTDAMSIAFPEVGRHEADTGLFDAAVVGRFVVKYAPPLFVDGGPTSRWTPHPHAQNPEAYALGQLFLSLLTNMQPHHNVVCQLQLKSLFDADATTGVCIMPHGVAIPRNLPTEVQRFCRAAMALKELPPTQLQQRQHAAVQHRSGGVPTSAIRSLQEFRDALHALHSACSDLPDLPHRDPSKTSFRVEEPVDDYGWLLHRHFDAHAV